MVIDLEKKFTQGRGVKRLLARPNDVKLSLTLRYEMNVNRSGALGATHIAR